MDVELKKAILPGFSRYEMYETGIIKYRGTDKTCPNYDDVKNGYRKIKLYPDIPKIVNGKKQRKSFWVSRLVWEAFWGPIPPKMEIDHKDGNRLNNTLDNLMLVTHKQNNDLKKQRDRYLFSRKQSKQMRNCDPFLGLD